MKIIDKIIQLILTAMLPLALTQCDIISNEDEGKPSGGENVTLSLKIDGAISKTTIQENGSLSWSENDMIYVNGEWYSIQVDPSDPSYATVELPGAAEYFGFYSEHNMPEESYEDPEGYWMYFQNDVDYTYLRDNKSFPNPMAAYSTGGELLFRNIAGIVRLNMTSGPAINRIVLVSNNGEPLSEGSTIISKDELRSGNLAEHYPLSQGGIDCINLFFNDPMSTDPGQIDIVVPASTYTKGFTAYIYDTEGNICVKTTDESIDITRSTLHPMASFQFTQFSGTPAVSLTEITAADVKFSLSNGEGQSNPFVQAILVEKSYYDQISGNMSELQNLLYNGIMLKTGQKEPYSFFKAMTSDGFKSISPDTEYMLLTSYIAVGEYVLIGDIASEKFTSLPASGTTPGLSVTVSATYDEVQLSISASDAAYIYFDLLTRACYERMKSEGMEDDDIAINGIKLANSEVEEAIAGGFSHIYTPSYFDLMPGEEHLIVAYAVSEGGMGTVSTESFTPDPYINPSAEWEEIGQARMSIESVANIYDEYVAVEKMSGRNIYRFNANMNSNAYITDGMAEYGFYPIFDEEPYYIYIEDVGPNMIIAPYASYIGFSSDEQGKAYISCENGIIDRYDSTMNIYAEGQIMARIPSSKYPTYVCMISMRLEDFPLPTASSTASNENFTLGSEISW